MSKEIIQKRIEQDDRMERVYINYADEKIILFKDKSKTKIEGVFPLNDRNKKRLLLNTLLFFKWG